MTDNLLLSDRKGVRLATDQVSGVHVLRVKLQVGADGSAADVSDAHPVPVTLAGGAITVSVLPEVTIAALPAVTIGAALPAGANAIGSVSVSNFPGAQTVVQGAAGGSPWLMSLSGTADVSDRAARLVGVVYGSQGAQLKQTATNNNLQAELAVGGTLIDPRAVRALTSSDVVTAAQGSAATLSGAWPAKLSDGTNMVGVSTFAGGGTTYGLKVDNAGWIGSTAPTVGQKAMSSSIPVVIASDQTALPAPALTKGAQGSTGYSVQNLKDAGRSRVVISFESTATATADTLLSLVKKTNGSAAGGATSIAVANGKTLRITCVVFSVRANAAAAAFGTLTLRENTSGTVLISSPTWGRVDVGNTEAVVGAARSQVITIPDGIEFSGNNQIGASLSAQATTNIVSVELIGFEY